MSTEKQEETAQETQDYTAAESVQNSPGDTSAKSDAAADTAADVADSHIPHTRTEVYAVSTQSGLNILLIGIGVFLIVVGALVLLPVVFGPFWHPFRAAMDIFSRLFWPVFLIVAGIFVVSMARNSTKDEGEIVMERPSVPPRGTRLMRSSRNRLIGGVCGGIAEYFNVDPTLVRIIAVILALLPGPAVLAYLIAWIIIPLDRS